MICIFSLGFDLGDLSSSSSSTENISHTIIHMDLTAESHSIPLSDRNSIPLIGLGTYGDPHTVRHIMTQSNSWPVCRMNSFKDLHCVLCYSLIKKVCDLVSFFFCDRPLKGLHMNQSKWLLTQDTDTSMGPCSISMNMRWDKL